VKARIAGFLSTGPGGGDSIATLHDLGGRLIARAQTSGQLRADLTHEDLAFVTWVNARILRAVRAAGATGRQR
jgi:hypothetical protein